jgi:hypothetical protein
MPGVVVTTGAVAGPSTPTRAPSSTYFVAGQAERGSTDAAVLVQSFAEFVDQFGALTTYGTLYNDVKTYFQEGGARAYVTRVVGPAATKGALASPLMDQAGTPLATLSVTAASAGAWSSRVSVKVLAGAVAGTFRIQVLFDGVLVKDYTNLHSPQEAVSRVNADSRYIRLADAGSATVAPNNNPAAVGPLTLTAGTDDRASITSTHYVAALTRFEKGLGDGAVAIPGIGESVHAGLIAHANDNNRIALLVCAQSTDKATLIATAAALDAPRAGLFAPWIRVPDGYGGAKAISPEGFVAAARAKAHELTGPWRAAAGEGSRASYVVAPDQQFTVADANDLDGSKVNVIRTIASTVRLYGWRSVAADVDNWGYLTGAEVVNRVVTEAEKQLEQYVFGVIDSSGHLLATIRGTLVGIVLPMARAGGLFARYDRDGAQLDPGYSVVTDSTINPVSSLATNTVLANVGIRVSPVAAQVQLTVTKAAVTAAL